MVQYPVRTQRYPYSGKDPNRATAMRKKEGISILIEEFLNQQLLLQEAPLQIYLYSMIAKQTRFPRQLVYDCCNYIDARGDGFTAIRHGLTLEQALEEASSSGSPPIWKRRG